MDAMFWGNTSREYLFALVICIVAYFALKIFQIFVLARLRKLAEKTVTDIDDFIVALFSKLRPPLYLTISIYLGLRTLDLSGTLTSILNKVVFAVVAVYATILVAEAVVWLLNKLLAGKDMSPSIVGIMDSILRGVVWIFAIVMIFSNWGINVTSLVAGIGIGGIAIAFAFQNILEDIFSSFSIFIDKPFREEDSIVVGNDTGKVEKIGIKTTRLRSPQGEQIIISNRELTTTRIHNYKRIKRRRQLATLGVTYETSKAKLEKIPGMMKEIADKIDGITFDRAHFVAFAASSLDFQFAYYIEEYENYSGFLDKVQEVNYALVEAFAKEKIDFAYPTQTLHIEK